MGGKYSLGVIHSINSLLTPCPGAARVAFEFESSPWRAHSKIETIIVLGGRRAKMEGAQTAGIVDRGPWMTTMASRETY